MDTYFTVLKRIAATLQWPQNVWPLLLQCKLVGKAQEVCAALTLEQSLDYDAMKNAVLHALEQNSPEITHTSTKTCSCHNYSSHIAVALKCAGWM